MAKNRYSGKLMEENQNILNLSPANVTLRLELAKTFGGIVNKLEEHLKPLVLEVGVGEGDLSKYLIRETKDVNYEFLDVSFDMLMRARKNLDDEFGDYAYDWQFVHNDIETLLRADCFSPNIITSAWTIHNFSWDFKKKVLGNIYKILKNNYMKPYKKEVSSYFLLMDKIYPDDLDLEEELLERQISRFSNYLGVNHPIIAHEYQDYQYEYLMKESETIACLEKIGFKDVKILDRIERDVLLVARKNEYE
ncbi:MAG: class I SAM-dependent methyltransferase [Nanoarchaeota archaeon]|nr:class I SAM-dependent methyltransferase [Nanoarchaeota archaeon]